VTKGEAGKGSVARPVNGKLYRDSFDRIFGSGGSSGSSRRDARPKVGGKNLRKDKIRRGAK
jgi:hypothetical protein